MKNNKLIIFFVALILGVFFFMPARVSGYTYNPDEDGNDFTPYKNEIVFATLDGYKGANIMFWLGDRHELIVYIDELAASVPFQFNLYTDFSSLIATEIQESWSPTNRWIGKFISDKFGLDGMFWNPWLQIWQLEYPEEPVDKTAADWFEHISQFEGVASCVVFHSGESGDENFIVSIVEEPSGEFDGCNFVYGGGLYSEDWIYFEPRLQSVLKDWAFNMFYWDLASLLEDEFGEDYNGYLYWNFENHYWQIDYYNKSEFNNKEVDMVTDLLETLAEIGAGIGDLFGRIVESVGQFFYTPGTGDTPGSFTIIGILTIAAVVVSLSMWVLRLILRLFKLRG